MGKHLVSSDSIVYYPSEEFRNSSISSVLVPICHDSWTSYSYILGRYLKWILVKSTQLCPHIQGLAQASTQGSVPDQGESQGIGLSPRLKSQVLHPSSALQCEYAEPV